MRKEIIRNNKLILKTQQRFRSEKCNVFTEDNQQLQSTDSIEIYSYRMNKDLVYKKEEIKCNNIIKQYKHV